MKFDISKNLDSVDSDFITCLSDVQNGIEQTFGKDKFALSISSISMGEIIKGKNEGHVYRALAYVGRKAIKQDEDFDQFINANILLGEQLPLIHQSTYCHQPRVSTRRHNQYEDWYEISTLPSEPVSNFAVIAVKGKRARGEFVLTRISGGFLPKPGDYSPIFLESLNKLNMIADQSSSIHTIADASKQLLSFEKEFVPSGYVIHAVNAAKRIERVNELGLESRAYCDVYFLPTMVDNPAFSFQSWSNYPAEKKPSDWNISKEKKVNYDKNKYFFVWIAPYRDSTLIVVNYPMSQSHLDFQMGWLKWVINEIISLLSSKENTVDPTQSMKEEKHPYWSVLNQIRVDKFPNLPHLTFEAALKDIEDSEFSNVLEDTLKWQILEAIAVETRDLSEDQKRELGEKVISIVSNCVLIDKEFRDSFINQNSPEKVGDRFDYVSLWLNPDFADSEIEEDLSDAKKQFLEYYFAAAAVGNLTKKEFVDCYMYFMQGEGDCFPEAYWKLDALSRSREAKQKNWELLHSLTCAGSDQNNKGEEILLQTPVLSEDETRRFGQDLLSLLSECYSIDLEVRQGFLKLNTPEKVGSRFVWLKPYLDESQKESTNNVQERLSEYIFSSVIASELSKEEFLDYWNYVHCHSDRFPEAYWKMETLARSREAKQRTLELTQALDFETPDESTNNKIASTASSSNSTDQPQQKLNPQTCPSCHASLTWLPQYQRWYCYNEQKYDESPHCPICGGILTWVPQYQQWYCYNDQKYPDVQRCSTCKGLATWIPQYRRWYCYKDQKYL